MVVLAPYETPPAFSTHPGHRLWFFYILMLTRAKWHGYGIIQANRIGFPLATWVGEQAGLCPEASVSQRGERRHCALARLPYGSCPQKVMDPLPHFHKGNSEWHASVSVGQLLEMGLVFGLSWAIKTGRENYLVVPPSPSPPSKKKLIVENRCGNRFRELV